MPGVPAVAARPTRSVTSPLLGELEGVGEQVLQHLAQAARVGRDRRREVGRELDGERRAPAARRRASNSLEHRRREIRQRQCSLTSSVTVPDSTFARSRMSLSSRSRSLPEERITLGVLHLRRGQVLLGVALELAGEDQQAVERRAQLVRHVREELRLVLRRDRQLLGLLLDQALGQLDLLVLALDLDVLLGQARWPACRGPRWSCAAPPGGPAAPAPATAPASAGSR